MLEWFWTALGGLALIVICEELRIYKIHRASRKNEEIFQTATPPT